MLNTNCGIYIIISPSNGRYVGSSKNIKKRFNRYKNLACINQYALISSFKKYGYENHKIKMLMYCKPEELLFWERVFGDLYRSLADFENGLNIRLPGYDEPTKALTEEMRAIIRNGCKKRWDKKEERRKTSERAKEVFKNPELRNRLRDAANNQWDEEARKRKSDKMREYYKNNPEARKRLVEANKAFFQKNPDARKKSNQALVDYYKNDPNARYEVAKKRVFKNGHPTAKKIINTETGKTYPSIRALAKELGVNEDKVGKLINEANDLFKIYKYL